MAAEITAYSTLACEHALHDIAPMFERASGHKINIMYEAGPDLMAKLRSPLAGDLVIGPSDFTDGLLEEGRLVAGSRVDFVHSGSAIAVRKGASKPDVGTPEKLKAALLAAKSVAHSKTGMSGIYFPTVLARLGIADEMRSKIVMPDPGTPVGDLVAKGDAELGVQQISELLPVAGVEVVGPLPPSLQKITTFTAAVLTAAKEPDAAAELAKFVATRSPPLLAGRGLEPA